MIPIKEDTGTVTSNMAGTEYDMMISPEFMGHIQQILSGVYNDSILAVIREYSTNARDSHIEAGNTSPIQVTLPGSLNHTFKVKDYGIGMSEETIDKIYRGYGISTKTASNDFNGALGIGCKSALSYTKQFTVRAVKDGELIQVLIGSREDGSGTMKIVSKTKTSEPNSVEVSIPVNPSDVAAFNKTAYEFFFGWKPGTVIVDGKQPESMYDVCRKFDLGDGVTAFVDERTASSWGSNYKIVMGNVSYPMPQHNFSRPTSFNTYFEVPNGTLSFPPTRESLKDNDDSRAYAKNIVDRLTNEVMAYVKAEIDACAGYKEAYKRSVDLKRGYPGYARGNTMRFNGEVIPNNGSTVATAGYGKKYVTWAIPSGNNFDQIFRCNSISLQMLSESIVITGMPETTKTTLHASMKHKIVKYVTDNGIKAKEAIVVVSGEQIPASKWVDPVATVTWGYLKEKVKVPRDKSGASNFVKYEPHDKYDFVVSSVQGKPAFREVESGETLAFFSPNETFSSSFPSVNYRGTMYKDNIRSVAKTLPL